MFVELLPNRLLKLRFRSKVSREKVTEYDMLLRPHSKVTRFGYLLARPIIVYLALFQTVAFPQCDHHDFVAMVGMFKASQTTKVGVACNTVLDGVQGLDHVSDLFGLDVKGEDS
jgi:hypothetical protein